ncbi:MULTISPECIES: hypothetical protein [Corallincola]|uniref:Sel1 repeat family protein n=2 Tax=Corallincola TaxID=1775176 RepID=A0ABY1WLE1_9GAMM|nr:MULTISPECIES: hypothetical protein [Corallincola]TAA41749.1 hypothetical protein EXY25_16035 [Corallincola spongiicola]TCI02262.1 hypothetical protein EZV61_15135 [Corallincola luteus]
MNNELQKAESALKSLQWKLEADEYDDEDEYNEATDSVEPAEVFEAAKKAALLGSTQGMHLYGVLLSENEETRAEAKSWVLKAANQGCWGAMDDIATELADTLGSSIVEQLAYFDLSGSGGNIDTCVKDLKKYSGIEVTEEQYQAAISLRDSVKNEFDSKGIEKSMCDCVFS